MTPEEVGVLLGGALLADQKDAAKAYIRAWINDFQKRYPKATLADLNDEVLRLLQSVSAYSQARRN